MLLTLTIIIKLSLRTFLVGMQATTNKVTRSQVKLDFLTTQSIICLISTHILYILHYYKLHHGKNIYGQIVRQGLQAPKSFSVTVGHFRGKHFRHLGLRILLNVINHDITFLSQYFWPYLFCVFCLSSVFFGYFLYQRA